MHLDQVACVIPARLAASRFPNKLIQKFQGKSLIQHTVEKALSVFPSQNVYCLTDDSIIEECLNGIPCQTILTGEASNGTERIAKNLKFISESLIVNLQGDDPQFPKKSLVQIRDNLLSSPDKIHVCGWNFGMTEDLIKNPNRVKISYNNHFQVIDFEREPKDWDPGKRFALQQGVYGYNREFLLRYLKTPPSKREAVESHELLRILPLPETHVFLSQEYSQSIDVPEDLKRLIPN